MSSFCFLSPLPLSLRTSFSTRLSLPTRRHLRVPLRRSVAPMCADVEGVKEKLEWIGVLETSEIEVGSTKRIVTADLDLCIACAYDGQVYALGNKSSPLGYPLTDGEIVEIDGDGYVKCAQNGTLFRLSDGEVKDKENWLPKPVIIGNVLRALFPEPSGVPVYAVREAGGVMQVLVDVNARAQYETKYWKGILDASGKADGGYY